MTDNSQTHNVVVTRVFDAPVEEVWKAWLDPEYVRQWWGPTGFTCPLADMDFREGGTSLVCMRAPQEYGGQELYNTWTYGKIEQHKRIEFIHRFTDQNGRMLDPAQIGIPPGVPKEVRHVISFKALGRHQTELTVTEYGYATAETRDLSQAGMKQCLDKMAGIFSRA
ncbi:MAG TPA: SRPBCC domain-containing protein [Anaerolineales bacterium]|nr:SRPBCC domain-containing protein [Anaerolineales bacterium]